MAPGGGEGASRLPCVCVQCVRGGWQGEKVTEDTQLPNCFPNFRALRSEGLESLCWLECQLGNLPYPAAHGSELPSKNLLLCRIRVGKICKVAMKYRAWSLASGKHTQRCLQSGLSLWTLLLPLPLQMIM